MDIATHAAMGLITASPFVSTRPGLAAGLMLGSVLPDLDVLGRIFGKRAALATHQTWTHSLPLIVLLAAAVWLIGRNNMLPGGGLALGLGVAMIVHSLLDVTTTQGVALFAPFNRKRFCLEWVFSTDKIVMFFSTFMLALVFWNWEELNAYPFSPMVGFLLFIAIYWCLKAWLRARAGKLTPYKTVSLTPGDLVPWQFLGVRQRQHSQMEIFRLNAITGKAVKVERFFLYDLEFEPFVERLPEFRAMRNLSPAYHIIEAGRRDKLTVLHCRDLRVRKSRRNFGDLKVWLDDSRKIQRVEFRV